MSIDTTIATISFRDATTKVDIIVLPPYIAVGIEQDDKQSNVASMSFQLSQNYPNPFNPITIIGYTLPTVTDVDLTIYNPLGQKIKALLKKRQTPGVYEIHWDGRNENGEFVSSGIYFYLLRTDSFTNVKKMVFLR